MSLPTCPTCFYAKGVCKKTGVEIRRSTGCTFHTPKPITNYDLIISSREAGNAYVKIGRRVDHETMKRIAALPLFEEGPNRGGFLPKKFDSRQYPYGSLARRTIGYVKDNSKSSGNSMIGLEGRFDYVLHGKEGVEWMKVTDNSYIGNGVSTGVLGSAKDAQLIVNAAYGKQTSPTNLLTWVESHDTFASETNHSSNKKIARLWAILAARKDTNSLFFARPDNNLTVAQIGTYDFEDEVFGTVNRFHNRFVGAEEEQHAVDTNFYVNERYSETDQGAVVIDLKLSGSHEISFHHLPDGYYFDQITGNPVKINGGRGTISFEERGVAVLTKTRNLVRPSLCISHRGGLFSSPFDVTLQLHQASASSYSLDGGEEISFADSVKIRIGEGVESGNSTILTVHYTNGQYSARRTFVYRKVTLIEGYFNILNLKESYLTDYALYVWSWGAGGSSYHQDYTWNAEHKILLMNDVSNYTGFLLVIFEKGHTISNPHVWESCLKQTADINPKASFFDASTF